MDTEFGMKKNIFLYMRLLEKNKVGEAYWER